MSRETVEKWTRKPPKIRFSRPKSSMPNFRHVGNFFLMLNEKKIYKNEKLSIGWNLLHQNKSFPHVENWALMISVLKTVFSGVFGSIFQQSPLTKLFCFNRFQPEILHVFMISNLGTFIYNAKTFFPLKKWYFI